MADPSPTDTPAPTDTAPPPPPPPPDPVAGVRVSAADVIVGDEYWQGGGTGYDLVITVANTGDSAEHVKGSFTLANGLRRSGVSASGGCTDDGGVAFSCTLGAGSPPGRVVVRVTTDPDAWRRAPLTGNASAKAAVVGRPDITATGGDGYSVILPPGPPTPGIQLSASDLLLPAQPAGRTETLPLTVKLRNTGAVPATGIVELIIPPGVSISTVPGNCANPSRPAPNRLTCDVGRVAAGQEQAGTYALTVRPEVRADAPVSGAVHGSLTPAGQDTVTVQTVYRILVTPAVNPSATPSGAAAAADASADPGLLTNADARGQPIRVLTDSLTRQLSILPILGAVVGLFTALGVLVIVSLRRRLRGEISDPQEPIAGEQPVVQHPGGVTVPEKTRLADVRSKV
jgi:hypothetical protein